MAYEIQYKAQGEENMEAHVITTGAGWAVKLYDADAAEYVLASRVFYASKGHTLAAAIAFADSIKGASNEQ